MMQKVIRMCKSRTFGMRAIAFLLAFLMVISPLTAFAADMDPDISDLPTSGEDVGDDLGGQEITSAVYTVRWLDSDETELSSETREGTVGTSVMVNPEDLLSIEGYTFRNEDERNVQTDELAADGTTELKLYFDENEISDTTVVEDDKIDVTDVVEAPETTEEKDMTIDGSAEENDMTINESESLEETDSEVTYTVEWRNGFNQLIQSETRVAKAGSEVSVTEADKAFDKTGRYFFNDEADNVLYGAAAKDLVLVLFFDDVNAVMPIDTSNSGDRFHFIVDMRKWGGEKKEIIRTDIHPNAEFMSLYDKFDWAYAEDNFDFTFSHYYSNLGDSPAGATTPYFGTFYSRNKTDRLNADWYFGWAKNENGVRDVTWMPVFEDDSVTPKCGFVVNGVIQGAYSKTIEGSFVADNPSSSSSFVLKDYLSSSVDYELKQKKYSYSFEGYQIESGTGTLQNEADADTGLIIPETFCVIKAVYTAIKNPTIQVDVEFSGDLNELYTSNQFLVSDLDTINIKDLYPEKATSVLNSSLYEVSFSGFTCTLGSATISDVTMENATFSDVSGFTTIKAKYILTSNSKFRVNTIIDTIDSTTNEVKSTKICEGDWIPFSTDDHAFHLFSGLSNAAAFELGISSNLKFEGYFLESGSGSFFGNTHNLANCEYLPIQTESAVVVAKFSRTNTISYGDDEKAAYRHIIKISGPNIPTDQFISYQSVRLNCRIDNLSFGKAYTYNGTCSDSVSDIRKTAQQYFAQKYNFNVSDYDWKCVKTEKTSSQYGFEASISNDKITLSNNNGKRLYDPIWACIIEEYQLIPQASLQVDTHISGAYESIIEGEIVDCSETSASEQVLKTYVDQRCIQGYDQEYEYTFDGYELVTGSGSFDNPRDMNSIYHISNGVNHIVAKYIAEKSNNYATVDVKLHITGLVNKDMNLDHVVISKSASIDLNNYLINLDISDLPHFDLMQYSMPELKIDSGDGKLDGFIYSNMSGNSTSVISINYTVSERDSDPSIMYLKFEDGDGNQMFDALPTKDGNITLPIGYYVSGHGTICSHKAWVDKTTGIDVVLPSIKTIKTVKITKTTTVIPRVEYYHDNLKLTAFARVMYEDNQEKIIPNLTSSYITEHKKTTDTRNIDLNVLSLRNKLDDYDPYYRYEFVSWSEEDSNIVSGSNQFVLSNKTSESDAVLQWIVNAHSNTNTQCSYLTMAQNYRAIGIANDIKVNTVITGEINNIIEGSVDKVMLSEAVALKTYVDQDIFDDNTMKYTFKGYEIVSGTGQLTSSKDENAKVYVGDRTNGICEINAIYETTKRPSITYDTQGGSVIDPTYAEDGRFMVTRKIPIKDGFIFKGWALKADTTDIDYLGGDLLSGIKNVTLYAVYTDAADAPVTKTYTITYNTNGGSAVAETKSYNGIFTVTRRMPEKEGLTFVGWTRTPDSENANDVDYVGGDSFPAEEDLTLYALYVKATPPIHVNGGSEVETTVTVENNQYIIVITIPTKPGYTFPGWDTDGDGTPDVEPGDPIVTDDLDTPIDAVWTLKVTPAQYVTTNDSTWLSNVLWDSMDTVDSDHVRGVDDALIDADGRAMVQIPDSVPVRTGYVFVGWELSNPMLRVMARSNAYYQAGDAVYMDEIDSAYENGLRFTAIWEPEDSDDGNTPGTGDKPGTDDGNTPGTGDKPGTDDGNTPGIGDKPGTDDGNTPGTGDKPDTDDGNTPGTGDKPGTDDGNTPGIGDKPGTDDGNTPGIGDKPGTDDGNTPGIGDKPGTDDGNTPGIGDKPTLTKPGHMQPTLNLNYGKPNRTPGMVYRNSGRTSIAPKTGDTTNAVKTTTAALALLGSLVVLSVTLERKKRSIQ